MNPRILLGLNRLFPRRWRWAAKRLLRMDRHVLHPQLAHLDFRGGPNVILDVGANRGNFATNILLQAPLAEVHCFEPNPDVFPILREKCTRLGRNGGRPRAIANQAGVGSSPGSLELIVTEFHQASSFLPVTQANVDGFRGVDFSVRKRVSVPVVTLERYAAENRITSAKLAKIDVQGFELEVLKGCGEFLKRIEHLLIEVQFTPLYEGAPVWTDILEFLFDRGFYPNVMAEFCVGPDARPLQADILFDNQGADAAKADGPCV